VPITAVRSPSEFAQPVYMELFITTVFMRGRTVYRRITERAVRAMEDRVDGYMARALAGSALDSSLTDIPVRPLWGCRTETPVVSHPGENGLTKLIFPTTLRRDGTHYFSSEAVNETLTEERLGVNVEVDHHGIAPGRLGDHDIPVSGLTIRVRFDEGNLPETTWWYAEQTERERRRRPPDGDPRLLDVVGGSISYTFLKQCFPRENYGVSFQWPSPDLLEMGPSKRQSRKEQP
jgi:hypothetical protein